jgi:hypothetical protein
MSASSARAGLAPFARATIALTAFAAGFVVAALTSIAFRSWS